MQTDLDLLGVTWDEATDLTRDLSDRRSCIVQCVPISLV